MSDQVETRPRRGPRFSLRSLMVVIVLASIGLGTLVMYSNRQRAAVAWVRSFAGQVEYDGTWHDRPVTIPGRGVLRESWWRRALGRDFFCDVVAIRLHDPRATDLRLLSGLTKLRKLDLAGTGVSDLSPLSNLIELTHLDLAETQVEDLAPLRSLSRLEYLNLKDTLIDDVAPLAPLVALEKLWLNNTRISAIDALTGLTRLEDLYQGRTPVRDIEDLGRLPTLIWVQLEGADVSQAQVDSLQQALPNCIFGFEPPPAEGVPARLAAEVP